MTDVSNKTLVGLLLVAIVVSIVGIFLSLNKLGEMRPITGHQVNNSEGPSYFTGEVLGSIQLEIQKSNATATFEVEGNTTAGEDFCTAVAPSSDLNGHTFGAVAASYSTECGPATDVSDATFVFANVGNTNIDLDMTSGSGASLAIIDGTSGSYRAFAVEENNACSGTLMSQQDVTTSKIDVCTNLGFGDDNAILVRFNFSISEYEPPQSNVVDTYNVTATVV